MRRKRKKRNNLSSVLVAGLAMACLMAALPARAAHHPKPYALIAGTVWTPSDTPLGGVKVKIRPAGRQRSKWQMVSSERGEFMQRVPPGPGDYVVWCDPVKLKDGRVLVADPATVHIYSEERADTGLHLRLETKVK